jgi:toxin CcdB
MAQFDLFANPIPSARGAYPFVVVLQSDLAGGGRDRIVAPLAPRAALAPVAGRLTPVVSLDDTEYVVLVPGLAGVRQRDLRERVGTLEAAREPLLAAVDYLFFGV